MITLAGEKMASRVAASLLHATGLDELVCSSYSGEFAQLCCCSVLLAFDAFFSSGFFFCYSILRSQ